MSAQDHVLLGELGRYSDELFIKCRVIIFWHRIISWKQDKVLS